MKKSLFIFIAVLALASCGPKYSGPNGEKVQKDAEAEFISAMTSADTTAVLDLGDKFMSLLQNGQIEEAVDMIYVIYDEVVYRKSDLYTSDLIKQFNMFPVYSYSLTSLAFSTEGNNDLAYNYEFTRASDSSNARTLKLMLNPVKADGSWLLTMKSGHQSSRDLPVEKQIHEMAPAPQQVHKHASLQ